MDFPNYLMTDSHQKKATQPNGEIVLAKPFRQEYEERKHERYERKKDETLQALYQQREERGNRHFTPSVVPSILTGLVTPEMVDYQSIYQRLQLTETDLLLFEVGQAQLSHNLEQFGTFGQQTIATKHEEKSLQTSESLGHVVQSLPMGQAQLFKKSKKSKRNVKKGLHRSFTGILEQEHTSSKSLFESYQKERV